MNDNLYTQQDAQSFLMSGIRKAANAVGSTMGTAGKNSLIETLENPGVSTTNDGATILGSIRFANHLEEMGRKILMEATSRANKASGDGSSTTTVLCSAILEEGNKHLEKYSPMEIKRSLEACIPLIESSINKQKKKISVNEVAKVASISAEDEEIGKKIQEIYEQIGKDGIIQWDISKSANDVYTIGSGITINGATYASPYMCDIDSKSGMLTNQVKMKNVPILLLKQKITSAIDFENLFKELFNRQVREIAVFCEEIEPMVINDLIKTKMIRGFNTVVIKMPILWRNEWWEDLRVASGGKVVGEGGITLLNMTSDVLGKFENLTVTKEDVIIDGTKDLSEHIQLLLKDDENKLRASRLNVKTARYYVGAYSEQALYYKRLKVEDAINAASCALENGIVVGGGISLINTIKSLKNAGIGGIILKEALKEPFRRIVSNSGKEPKEFEKKVGGKKGFNSQSRKIENLYEKGIIDPADVVLNAVKSAIGVAATVLTIGSVVLLPKENAPL